MQLTSRTLSLFGLLWFIGCSSPSSPTSDSSPTSPSAPTPTPAAQPAAQPALDPAAEAQQIFATRCTVCHGPTGAGDGPGSAGLTPKPRNFSLPDWQKSVSDDHIGQIIQYGGAAVGKSPTMPGNPDLTSKPEVVKELVKKIRSFGK